MPTLPIKKVAETQFREKKSRNFNDPLKNQFKYKA